MAEGKIDPIHQFEVVRVQELSLFGVDISITNASLFMLLGAALVVLFFAVTTSKTALVPSRGQSMGELSYEFIANMIRSTAGEDGLKFFPFIFTLFFFILFANFVGMVPYFFTTTSHLAVTATLAVVVFLLVTLVGLFKNGVGFLGLFAPSLGNMPTIAKAGLYLLLIPIEIISYFARPLTHSVRLFANMLAGHIMLKLLVAFAAAMLTAGAGVAILAPLPFILAIAITALEFLVAFLQAYVFAILTCVYLSDALHPGHH